MKPFTIKESTIFAVLISLLFALPFFVARFVPAVDLPQHLAQIRLFWETLHGQHEGVFVINWFSPNTLVYIVLGLCYVLFPAIIAGKITLYLLMLGWVAGVFAIARFRNRSAATAILCCLFVFNACLYWGMINHLIGFPFFALWLYLLSTEHATTGSVAAVVKLALCAMVLLLCHILWFGLAMAALILSDFQSRPGRTKLLQHGLAVVPAVVFAAIWLPHLERMRSRDFATEAVWVTSPFERLSPSVMLDAAFGGIKGATEPVIGIMLAGWLLYTIVSAARNRFEGTDRLLVSLAGVLFLVVLAGPDMYVNTDAFSSRWAPVAFLLLFLGLPQPKAPRLALLIAPLLLVMILSIATALSWKKYNEEELSGLESCLVMIPENQRVLGIDLIKTSDWIKGRPYLQLFSYAQVLHGGDINFTFAAHGSGIVVVGEKYRRYWHGSLEWSGERATLDDLGTSERILINAGEQTHALLVRQGLLRPLTANGYWRLYEFVTPPQGWWYPNGNVNASFLTLDMKR